LKLTTLHIVLFTTISVAAQRPSTAAWLTLQLPVPLRQKWQWHNDAGYRTLGASIQGQQYFYRTGMRYVFNKSWDAAAGTALFFTRTNFDKNNAAFGSEFRLWLEGNVRKNITSTTKYAIRLRTEQRFFSRTALRPAFNALRYRVRLQLQHHVNQNWSVIVQNEYMQQYATHKLAFDQNRTVISSLHKFSANTQLQAGYMWLQWPHQSHQHVAMLSFIKNIQLHHEHK
jgi:hypothetical protein